MSTFLIENKHHFDSTLVIDRILIVVSASHSCYLFGSSFWTIGLSCASASTGCDRTSFSVVIGKHRTQSLSNKVYQHDQSSTERTPSTARIYAWVGFCLISCDFVRMQMGAVGRRCTCACRCRVYVYTWGWV